jgi:signal transduction histidine kinase
MVRDRIQRASLTMKSMTETLLWLSREGDGEVPVESSQLGPLVDNTHGELAYLLSGKSVTVNVETDEQTLVLAVTPCVIVLNNLIRNAFQHTQQGHVEIVQKGSKVTITNVEQQHDPSNSQKDELGFGLGMQLVEKLTTRFHWRYQAHPVENGYRVCVSFDGE